MKTIMKTAIATAIAASTTSAIAATAAPDDDAAFFVGITAGLAICLWLSYRWLKGSITMSKEHGFFLVLVYWIFLTPIQMIHAIFIGTRPVKGDANDAKPFTQNITINNVIREPRTVTVETEVEGYTEGASGIVARTPK